MDPKIAGSRAQEKRGAKLHGGRRTIGSGNTPFDKGDVRTTDSLIEYKRTTRSQITLRLADIETNRRNALLRGRGPLFGIEIGGRDYLLVEAEHYQDLKEQVRAYSAQLGEGEVLPGVQRPVLPRARPRDPRAAQQGEGRVQRQPRYRSGPAVSDQGGVS